MPIRDRDEQQPSAGGLVDHLFRHKYGELVSSLCAVLGVNRLELIEDVVQDSLIRALKHWSYHGVPADPTAWLMVTSRNRAIDLMRRERSLSGKSHDIEELLYQRLNIDGASYARELSDDMLRLMFACCHKSISVESQVVIILKILSGLSIAEIARAFLEKETTIAQRITRAKRRLKEIGYEQLNKNISHSAGSLQAVLTSIYLVFNEGYNASVGDSLVRQDLVVESIRLVRILVGHPVGDCPEAHALTALICLQAARLPSRVDDDGNLVLLADQDRSRWDRRLISLGMRHLDRAARGNQVSVYHLEAGIAACHVVAADYGSTDWPQILSYYDALIELNNSPIVALNRCVAVAEVHGSEAGLRALDQLSEDRRLADYYLYHATKGEFFRRRGDLKEACEAYARALELTSSVPEQQFLKRRMQQCTG